MSFACVVVILIAALAYLFFTDQQFTEQQLHIFNWAAALVTVLLCTAILGSSHALLTGELKGTTIRLGGPVAAALIVFGTLSQATPKVSPRTVWVYVVAKPPGNGVPGRKVDRFTVRFRGKDGGPQSVSGQNGAGLASSVPWKVKVLEVDQVECEGFVPVNQQQGDAPPWGTRFGTGR